MAHRAESYSHSTVFGGGFGRIARAIGPVVRLWKSLMNRREVGRLAHLDDRALADIGLTRTDVALSLGLPMHEDPSTRLRLWALERRSARLQMQRLAHREALASKEPQRKMRRRDHRCDA